MKKIIILCTSLTALIYATVPNLKLLNFIDVSTQLEWQQTELRNQKSKTWKSAVSYCDNLDLNAKKDWRLPNLIELTSLVDDQYSDPAVSERLRKTTMFGGENYYWTSTSFASSLDNAWFVGFHAGNQSNGNKIESHYVRCVRSTK